MKTTINILIACLITLTSCNQTQPQTTTDGGTSISNSVEETGDKFIGKWNGKGWSAEITHDGDYYQWADGGTHFGKLQLKYKDGELQSGGMQGNVTYNKTNGHIFFFGTEFSKVE